MKRTFAQKIYEQDVESYKKWLCDKAYLNVRQGLDHILSQDAPPALLKESQLRKLGDQLIGDETFVRNSIKDKGNFVEVDETVTLISNFNNPSRLGKTVKSRPSFVKLAYQCYSYFPVALSKAYREIMGENLILDELSEVRAFYENCAQFDLWTAHELCAYISHSDPEALDFILEHSDIYELLAKDPEPGSSNLGNFERLFPDRFSRTFIRPDLYERNLPIIKSAILGGAFELIHLDQENWLNSSFQPKKGLEWAKTKGIDYHPILNEYLLASNKTEHTISSGYTTPYIEMMQEVINELEISKKNQGKKEAIAALFAKKLNDHKITPPSQKLADSMATLARLPESQQGRARRKG